MTPQTPPAPRRSASGVIVVLVLGLALAVGAVGFAVARAGGSAAGSSSPGSTAATTTASGQTTATLGTTAAIGTVSEGSTSMAATTGIGGVTVTATSYTSDEVAITISRVVTGSGEDTVTYFVADVVLAEGVTLRAALAGGDLKSGTADTSELAATASAILAINGDNAIDRRDGIIIRNGILYRDEPARIGLAVYWDGTVEVYGETETSGEELLAAGVRDTFSFGPALVVDGVVADGLGTLEVEVNPEHGIQGSQPRTGLGVIGMGHFVFVVVDGRSAGYSRGVTLDEFAAIFQGLGCSLAYNLDGGGSSTMWFMGEVVNDPLGRGEERSVGDILYVG